MILGIPALAAVPGRKAALMAELPQYFVLSENVTNDVTLLSWWFSVRRKLPMWYQHVLPQAVMLQPTSATAVRVFSMMEWMFREDQQAALEDYKETALLLRYSSSRDSAPRQSAW